MKLNSLILVFLAIFLIVAAADNAKKPPKFTNNPPRVSDTDVAAAGSIPNSIDTINSAAFEALHIITNLNVINMFRVGPQLVIVLGRATAASSALVKILVSEKFKPKSESEQRYIFEAFNKLVAGLLKLLDALLWFIARASGTFLDKLLLFAVRPFCMAIVALAEAIAKFLPIFARETAVLSEKLADSVGRIIELLDRARG